MSIHAESSVSPLSFFTRKATLPSDKKACFTENRTSFPAFFKCTDGFPLYRPFSYSEKEPELNDIYDNNNNNTFFKVFLQ